MRLPPRRHSRVVWEEGMYLAPHHFQAQRRHCEEAIAGAIDALFPFAYGLTSVALDTEALAGGTLALAFARGIFPDGTVFSVPDADPVPPPAPLAERFSPDRDAHVVHLTLPAWRSEAPNVRMEESAAEGNWPAAVNGESNGTEARYVAVVANVRDETAGEESAEVRFATKHLRLVLDVEVSAGEVSLAVARIRRDGAGRYVRDAEFIPPCLKLGASERLLGILRNVVGMVEAKGAALAASLAPSARAEGGMAPAAYVGNELATRWLLHAVRSAEAPLRHLLATRNAHPERLWLELSQLAGALCTFSLTTQARELAVYAHDDLGTCFGSLERHLRAHLDVVIAAHAVVIPLTRATEVLFAGNVSDPRCYQDGARWFLGVRSSVGARETLVRVPQLLKVCARKFVLELVRRAYPGLDLEHVPAPPSGLAPRAELSYFEIVMAGACAQTLRETREIGVYVPDGLPDATLEVAVLVPS
ncbi:MAG: type VI secretion system baseplate subunit TssK [Gemmatimonadaceae bacterium]